MSESDSNNGSNDVTLMGPSPEGPHFQRGGQRTACRAAISIENPQVSGFRTADAWTYLEASTAVDELGKCEKSFSCLAGARTSLKPAEPWTGPNWC